MRAVGRRIADAVDDGHLARIIQGLDLGQRRVKAEVVVNRQHLVGGDAHGRPVVVVTAVSVGNDGVQVVVAAGELDDDEDWVFGGGGHGNVGSAGRINARMIGGRSLAQGARHADGRIDYLIDRPGDPRTEMTTVRTDSLRRFSVAETDAMVAAGIVPAGEREALAAGRRFAVDEYLALGAAGILAKEERIELLDGEIIQMAPVGNRHQAQH